MRAGNSGCVLWLLFPVIIMGGIALYAFIHMFWGLVALVIIVAIYLYCTSDEASLRRENEELIKELKNDLNSKMEDIVDEDDIITEKSKKTTIIEEKEVKYRRRGRR